MKNESHKYSRNRIEMETNSQINNRNRNTWQEVKKKKPAAFFFSFSYKSTNARGPTKHKHHAHHSSRSKPFRLNFKCYWILIPSAPETKPCSEWMVRWWGCYSQYSLSSASGGRSRASSVMSLSGLGAGSSSRRSVPSISPRRESSGLLSCPVIIGAWSDGGRWGREGQEG